MQIKVKMGLLILLKNQSNVDVNPESHQRTYQESNFRNKRKNNNYIMENKEEKELRIVGGNINTFPITKLIRNRMKVDKLRQIVCNYMADILTISEHNLNIKAIPMDQRPETTMEGWRKECIIKMSCLIQDKDMYSLGGNGVISFDDVAKKIIEFGHDSKELGRWTWCTYKMKHNKNLTVFSCYRPAETQITYKVQVAQMAKSENDEIHEYDHDVSWYEDLKKDMEMRIQQGDHLVVIGDFNENIEDSNSRISLLMDDLRMVNPINERYGNQGATHIRGTECIDGVYVSSGVRVVKGGYIPFEWSPGDHRWPWIDIVTEEMMDHKKCNKMSRKATSKIPSVKKEFNDKLNEKLKEFKMEEKIEELEKLAESGNQSQREFRRKYERIDETFRRSVRYADKHCKKTRKGSIPFSDKTKRIMGEYTLLKMILLRQKLKGSKRRPSMKGIKRLAKKINSDMPLTYNNEIEILARCKINAKEYKDLKQNADEYRNTYLGNLAAELSDIDGKEPNWHMNQLKAREAVKKHWKCIKRYEKRGRGGEVEVLIGLILKPMKD